MVTTVFEQEKDDESLLILADELKRQKEDLHQLMQEKDDESLLILADELKRQKEDLHQLMQEKDDESLLILADELKRQKEDLHQLMQEKDDESLLILADELKRQKEDLHQLMQEKDDESLLILADELKRQKEDLHQLMQEKDDESLLILADELKRQKEYLHQLIIKLEKNLNYKQRLLNLEINHMKAAIEVMKHASQYRDMDVKKTEAIKVVDVEVEDEELEGMKELNHPVIITVQKLSQELRDARLELHEARQELTSYFFGIAFLIIFLFLSFII